MNNRKRLCLFIGIVGLFFVLTGVTFAFYNYTKLGSANTLSVGRIAFSSGQTNTITLTDIYPIKASEIMTRPDNVGTATITITGDTNYSGGIEYLLSITEANITVNGKEIPISLNVTATNIGTSDADYFDNHGGNSSIYKIISNNEVSDGNNLLVGYIASGQTGINGSVTIKAYVDADRIIITDTVEDGPVVATGYINLTDESKINGRTVFTTAEWNSMVSSTISFKVKVEANEGIWVEDAKKGYVQVRNAITAKVNAPTNSCNPVWVDDMGTTSDTSDDITYFSGTNTCVDMNYVWYSGKLWRITAIYPDGAMKLVTQNNISSIAFNVNNAPIFYTDANTTSHAYQWLNEDFYDTLYQPSGLIDTTKTWNATATSNANDRPANTTLVNSNVGLLNIYEYYNSYRCIGSATCSGNSYGTGYLNINYYSFFLNPYDSTKIWGVTGYSNYGKPTNLTTASLDGIRPAIYLKRSVEFTGSGTKNDPYRVVDDISVGNANDLINTRLSGEYVKLKNGSDEQVFRIIDIEDNKTKIIAVDYADNGATRKFATSTGAANTVWGSGTTTGTDTWYTYLNGTYLPSLLTTYGDIFDSGTYYMGQVGGGQSYKLAICSSATGNTKTCTKTSSQGTFNIGIPRYGELFATQQLSNRANSKQYFLMTIYPSTSLWHISDDGSNSSSWSNTTSLRSALPTLHLKSTVKIISGSGTESDPYVVGL